MRFLKQAIFAISKILIKKNWHCTALLYFLKLPYNYLSVMLAFYPLIRHPQNSFCNSGCNCVRFFYKQCDLIKCKRLARM